MKKMSIIIIISAIVFIILCINLFIKFHPTFGGKPDKFNRTKIESSPHYKDGKFLNMEPTQMMTGESMGKVLKKFIAGVKDDKPQEPIESIIFNKEAFLKKDSGITYTWFGHSTVLFNINSKIIVTDPVFSKAASPVPIFNKAFDFVNNYNVDVLPDIDVVLITHDHYDHLDYRTIQHIDSKTKKFIVPLGVNAHLLRWGISKDKIEVVDWYEFIEIDSTLKFISTPARHFSGRGTKDRDKTQWCSWVIQSGEQSIFFGGDSGYGKHFKEIGSKYGPFALTCIECGQYNENWSQIHAMPEQSVDAHIDLKGDLFLPIHWSKFKLSIHPWKEPIERAKSASEAKGVKIELPVIGELREI